MRKLFICLSVLLLPHLGQCGILFSENFSSGTLPSGWTNDSLGYQAIHLWYFNNPYARSITGANFDTNFAIFDSDQGSVDDGIPEIASLTTPQINIAGNTDQLFLVFDQQFQSVTNSSTLIEYLKFCSLFQ